MSAHPHSSSNNPLDLSNSGDSDESNSWCHRVTAMLLQPPPHCVLWVGLASGHMILFNATTRSPVLVVQRHQSDIRTIVDIRAKSEGMVMCMQWGVWRPSPPVTLQLCIHMTVHTYSVLFCL